MSDVEDEENQEHDDSGQPFAFVRWSRAENKKLKDMYNAGSAWPQISQELERPIPEVIHQWSLVKANRPPPYKWSKEDDALLHQLAVKYEGNWDFITTAFQRAVGKDMGVDEVFDRYKKHANPMYKSGGFNLIEDTLLILKMVQFAPFLCESNSYTLLQSELPWRNETVWRERAEKLFSEWVIPWTIEEDRLLLRLARINHKWSQICKEFASYKNRKGCLTRHKILTSRIGPEPTKQYKTLEEYHESYAMTRYNVFKCRHLYEIFHLLNDDLINIKTPNPIDYDFALERDKPPTDEDLRFMLLCFDREIVKVAIENLKHYMDVRNANWDQTLKEKSSVRKTTFERRKFDPEDIKSIASAIHIRQIKLKDYNATHFASLPFAIADIYKYYAQFDRTKQIKPELKRPGLPSAIELFHMIKIKEILIRPDQPEFDGLIEEFKNGLLNGEIKNRWLSDGELEDIIGSEATALWKEQNDESTEAKSKKGKSKKKTSKWTKKFLATAAVQVEEMELDHDQDTDANADGGDPGDEGKAVSKKTKRKRKRGRKLSAADEAAVASQMEDCSLGGTGAAAEPEELGPDPVPGTSHEPELDDGGRRRSQRLKLKKIK